MSESPATSETLSSSQILSPPDGDLEAGSLDAGVIAAASGALLEHLRRSGIRFVPNTNSESVQNWMPRFAPTGEPAEVAQSETTPAAAEPIQPPSPVGQLRPSAPATVKTATKPDPARNRMAPVASVTSSTEPYTGPSLPIADRQAQLDAMAAVVADCTKCSVLSQCRTQTVFGEGTPKPRFLFFGEGPGADEDQTGRPFVGKAGQLLTKMIEACHLSREQIYITNSVKCRPPGNRNPDPTEVGNCREYFEQQFEILRPEYIICLGAVPSQALLKTKLSIGRLRQTFHTYRDSKVLAIYHPAYLLRNPDAKRAAWADLQLLMKDAGL